jgi:hypothetical protein
MALRKGFVLIEKNLLDSFFLVLHRSPAGLELKTFLLLSKGFIAFVQISIESLTDFYFFFI